MFFSHIRIENETKTILIVFELPKITVSAFSEEMEALSRPTVLTSDIERTTER